MNQFGKFEIPGIVMFTKGRGGLPKIDVKTALSSAEIYLNGAQVTGFQKHGEPPLFFMSRLSQFAPGKAIRGGVPICFPWFGAREDESLTHGFARVTEWEIISATGEPKEGAIVRFQLPEASVNAEWSGLHAEFVVTVTDKLTMELIVTNQTSNRTLEFENCLHTYFAVGDIREVSIIGLKGTHYLDKTDGFQRKQETAEAIWITQETDRVYLDTASTVEIHDAKFRRTIRIEKSGSNSTVVWNPWLTSNFSDFAAGEHQQMVCVESGNVKNNRLNLAPGVTARLKVILFILG